MMLKIVLYAYSQGIVGSRSIARAGTEQVMFIALSGDAQPHFTTIAHFISHLGDDIATVFGAVLAICQRQGLIGGELFAIDGVKLPSNASKHNSGTRADFERQADKLEAVAKQLLEHHRSVDGEGVDYDRQAREAKKKAKRYTPPTSPMTLTPRPVSVPPERSSIDMVATAPSTAAPPSASKAPSAIDYHAHIGSAVCEPGLDGG